MGIPTVGIGLLLISCIGYASASHMLIAPQILREGVHETVVLNLDGVTGMVSVSATLILNGANTFNFNNQDAAKPIQMKVKYDKPLGADDNQRRQYVELIVIAKKGAGQIYRESLRMRLIENSGYIHIQTDRPIYKPEETVKVRVASLTQSQTPDLDREVEIVIRIPLDGVAVEKKTMRMPFNKFIDTTFTIPEFPVFGIWSIQARFADEKIADWSTSKFSVQEYVLPTFDVKLHMDKPYILVKDDMDEEVISGKITAKYSYGRKVSGSYFLVAKFQRAGSEQTSIFYQFPGEMNRRATIVAGEQKFSIKASEIRKVLEDGEGFDTLVDEEATVIIEASVTDRSQGIVEFDVSHAIKFVHSPYKFDISRMSKYFTPGTTFEIKCDVLDSVTGKPVVDVEVIATDKSGKQVVKQKTDDNGQINVKINMDATKAEKTYKIETNDDEVPDANEARMDIVLQPYDSPSNSILQLSAVRKTAQVGEENFGIDMWFNKNTPEMRYVILSRGAIVGSGIHKPEAGSTSTNMKIKITADMVPSFRIFVYYFNGKELVSNSLWLNVEDVCKKELTVFVKEMVRPGEHVNIEYTGSPNAILGLSAVDRAAYFLYDESRLTREGVFGNLEKYDNGCVREGGKNAQHVFEEGGLQLVGGPYYSKEDFNNHCKNPGLKGRKKRSVPDTVEAKYEQEAAKLKCKIDAMNPNLAEETCEARADRVEKKDGSECSAEFLKSCKEMEKQKKFARSSARAASNNAAGFKAFGASARSNFEESMLWKTAQLDANGRLTQLAIAKDSITTFEFDTISMHSSDGFCVAETQNMTIFKDVFIQLQVPYSIKRMEQVEIRATVFNYRSKDVAITVAVKMGEHICSHFPEGKFTDVATLLVEKNSAATASFLVLPLRVPESEHVQLEVKGTDDDDNLLDWIKKSILVQPEGSVREIKGTHAFSIKDDVVENFEVSFNFPEKYIPGSRKCWIYLYSNFMGPNIEFDPVTQVPRNDISKLIRMPGGCGEQTMLSMGPNVYAHKYLDSVNKIVKGSAQEQGYITKMKAGYANELKYRSNKVNPRVWSVWTNADPSVWLNAYVNKVFAQAKQYYEDMDVGPICDSISWLRTMQEAAGGFKSGRAVIHQEMHGAVGSKLSLTGYVVISLIESISVCPDKALDVSQTIDKAVAYLKANENDRQLDQPYALALVTYAMTISGKEQQFTQRLRNKLIGLLQYSPNNRLAFWKGAPLHTIRGTGTHAYWYQRRPLAIDVEATGYALLALLHGYQGAVSQQDLDMTRKITLWIIEQRDENGGFSTTQDTVVGLQALSAYMIWSNVVQPESNDINLVLTLRGENGSEWFDEPKRIHLDNTNENYTTPIPLPPNLIGQGSLQVQVGGYGDGTLSHRCIYNTLVEEDACHFELSATTSVVPNLVRAAPGQEKPVVVKLSLYIKKPVGEPSGQSIVEINLITGYVPVESTLQSLSKAYFVDGIIERYEIASQKVILYLAEITSEPTRLAFHINRALPVKLPEPATVSVYDYYEPTVKCTHFYGLPEDIPKLRTTPCKNDGAGEDMCKCAEGGCLACRSRDMQLKKTACLPEIDGDCKICDEDNKENCHDMTAVACRSNYVYIVKITRGADGNSGVFVEFEGVIEQVYKRGNDVSANRNQVRKFTTRSDCFSSCRDPELGNEEEEGADELIKVNRTLLMMGNQLEENIDRNGVVRHLYRLEEGSFLERIIPEDKCERATEKLEGKCLKPKLSKKAKKDCEEQRKRDQSCKNLRLLRRKLIKGCDNVSG